MAPSKRRLQLWRERWRKHILAIDAAFPGSTEVYLPFDRIVYVQPQPLVNDMAQLGLIGEFKRVARPHHVVCGNFEPADIAPALRLLNARYNLPRQPLQVRAATVRRQWAEHRGHLDRPGLSVRVNTSAARTEPPGLGYTSPAIGTMALAYAFFCNNTTL